MEALKYITKVDNDGEIKDFPPLLELKRQEVEIIILHHTGRKEMKLCHQSLRNKIKKGVNLFHNMLLKKEK